MGFVYQELKRFNKNSVVLEKRENIEIKQNSSEISQRKSTLIREIFYAQPQYKTASYDNQTNSSKQQFSKYFSTLSLTSETGQVTLPAQVPYDAKNAEEHLKQNIFHKNEKSTTQSNKPLLLDNNKKMKRNKFPKQTPETKEHEETWAEYLAGNGCRERQPDREGIAKEKFSLQHQCVCTSPRYGGDTNLAPRPRLRSVGSQITAAEVYVDEGAVGDHISMPDLKLKTERCNIFKECLNKELPVIKSYNPIVNCCYCYDITGQPTCHQCKHQRHQRQCAHGSHEINYCCSEYYYNCSNCSCKPQCSHCSNAGVNANSARRQRTDLDTENFCYRSRDRSLSPATSSQRKSYRKSSKEAHEVYNERQKRHNKEPKEQNPKPLQRSKSKERKSSKEKKIYKLLSEEGTLTILKHLDRYVDEHEKELKLFESKKLKTAKFSNDESTTPTGLEIRNESKVCQVTLSKRHEDFNKKKQSRNSSDNASLESQYSLKTLHMLKKMKIREYKPAKSQQKISKPKQKSDAQYDHKQQQKVHTYRQYIEMYEKENESHKSIAILKEPHQDFGHHKSEEVNFYQQPAAVVSGRKQHRRKTSPDKLPESHMHFTLNNENGENDKIDNIWDYYNKYIEKCIARTKRSCERFHEETKSKIPTATTDNKLEPQAVKAHESSNKAGKEDGKLSSRGDENNAGSSKESKYIRDSRRRTRTPDTNEQTTRFSSKSPREKAATLQSIRDSLKVRKQQLREELLKATVAPAARGKSATAADGNFKATKPSGKKEIYQESKAQSANENKWRNAFSKDQELQQRATLPEERQLTSPMVENTSGSSRDLAAEILNIPETYRQQYRSDTESPRELTVSPTRTLKQGVDEVRKPERTESPTNYDATEERRLVPIVPNYKLDVREPTKVIDLETLYIPESYRHQNQANTERSQESPRKQTYSSAKTLIRDEQRQPVTREAPADYGATEEGRLSPKQLDRGLIYKPTELVRDFEEETIFISESYRQQDRFRTEKTPESARTREHAEDEKAKPKPAETLADYDAIEETRLMPLPPCYDIGDNVNVLNSPDEKNNENFTKETLSEGAQQLSVEIEKESFSSTYTDFKKVMDFSLGFFTNKSSQTENNFIPELGQQIPSNRDKDPKNINQITRTTDDALEYLQQFLNIYQQTDVEEQCLYSVTTAANDLMDKLSSCKGLITKQVSSPSSDKSNEVKGVQNEEQKITSSVQYKDTVSTAESANSQIKQPVQKPKMPPKNSTKALKKGEDVFLSTESNREELDSHTTMKECFEEESYQFRALSSPTHCETSENYERLQERRQYLPSTEFYSVQSYGLSSDLNYRQASKKDQDPYKAATGSNNQPAFDPDLMPVKGILKPYRETESHQDILESCRNNTAVNPHQREPGNKQEDAAQEYNECIEPSVTSVKSLQQQHGHSLTEQANIPDWQHEPFAVLENEPKSLNCCLYTVEMPAFKQCPCMLDTYVEMLTNIKGKTNRRLTIR